jgi:teichuronic acid biosynthesis glycosyltransferase TuaC
LSEQLVIPFQAVAASSARPKRVLFVTSNWPTPDYPSRAPFVVREVRALQEAGVTVDVYVYDGGWSVGNYLRAWRETQQLLKQEKYDLIHAYFGQCGLVACAQRKLPVVITYAGSDVEGSPNFHGLHRYKHYVLITISRLLSLFADQVIVVSDNLGQKLPRKDYHVITIALDLDSFKPTDQKEARDKLGLPHDRKLVLWAAKPSNTRKRYELAVEVCRIAKETMNLDLVVATERPPEEIPTYMNAADALLLTSTNEGSPNVVREALACNLPVVSTDVGDVREQIGAFEGCAVCDDDKPEILAQALIRVLQRPDRPVLRDAVVNQNYRALGEKVVSVYEKALVNR